MRRGAFILAAVVPLTLAGCGDSTSPNAGLAGTYSLRTVNGDPVPATVDEGLNFKDEVLSSTLTLNANETFSGRIHWRSTLNGVTEESPELLGGRYSRAGNSLTLTDNVGQIIAVATWDGARRITLTADMNIWVYEK